jgi:hypothetical protein
MRARTAAWLAWGAWAILAGLGILLQSRTTRGVPGAVISAFVLGAFMTVGAIVVSRQPRNIIGWLCCAAGLVGALAGFPLSTPAMRLGRSRGHYPAAQRWRG